MTTPVRLYCHLRSPYSWLAIERLARDPVPLDAIPMSGVPEGLTPQGPDAPNAKRLAYIIEDVARVAATLGLHPQIATPFDTDWIRPNAAFWYARGEGRDLAFLHAAYRARWTRGEDLGDSAVIARAAQEAGLSPELTVAAMDDAALQGECRDAAAHAAQDGVIGVPFFVYEGQKFWGQDRVDALRAAMGRAPATISEH